MFKKIGAVLLAAACTGIAPTALADVKVLTAGAFKSVVLAIAPGFEKETGHKLIVDNDTAGALQKRVAGGEKFDVVILTPEALTQLAQGGAVDGASMVRLARVAIGVVVKNGAPRPDISTVDAFKATLLAAKSVAYIDPAAGGSSGIYLARLFEKMGIAEQIKAKAVLVPGGLVAVPVVKGEAEIGLHQVSEIITVPGATLVGKLPADIQNYTVYAAALSKPSADSSAAQAFLKTLASPQVRELLATKGMEAP